MKLDKALELFLSEYPNPATVRAYKGILLPMIEAVGKSRSCELVSTPDLLEYVADHVRTPDHAHATIRKHIKSIKTFFNWLVKIGELPKSPAEGVRQIRLRRDVNREKAMRDDEFERIVSYYQWQPQKLAIILFLGDTGCRAGGGSHTPTQQVRFTQLDRNRLGEGR